MANWFQDKMAGTKNKPAMGAAKNMAGKAAKPKPKMSAIGARLKKKGKKF